MKKMTKTQKLTAILEVVRNQAFDGFDVVEFLTHEIDILQKRRGSKSVKPSKTQVENEKLVVEIVEFLKRKEGRLYSSKELLEELEYDFSSQKMTALMKKAVDAFGVTKGKSTSDKKLVGYGFAFGEEN